MTSTESVVRAATAHLADRVAQAAAARQPLRLCGGGTHAALLARHDGEPLDLSGMRGVLAYEPSELVITVGAATPLAEVQSVLAEAGQMLPFEPRLAGGRATVGGAVAAQHGGPRRWTAGSVRDFLLGLSLIDGQGRTLAFGGQVIKNVAGFDVTRLQAGAWGSLGILTQISFKVLPLPRTECTLQFDFAQDAALHQVNVWAGQALPLSAASWEQGCLRIRLSGVSAAIEPACAQMGGELIATSLADAHWESLRERSHPFFEGAGTLWRLAVRPTAPALDLPGTVLWEWGGGQRWLRSDAPAERIRSAAAQSGGHAMLMRGGASGTPVFHPLAAPLDTLHRRIKQALDPFGILNPGTPDFL